jgi:dihydrofolate reductase
MRKLIVSEFMTLDGSIDEPSWSFAYWGDDIAAFKGYETGNGDTVLLGRKTYEGFAAAWPQRSNDDDPGAAYFNSVEKVVVTRTLATLEWQNSHVLQGDLIAGVTELKNRSGKDIVVHGSGTLARSLLREGLVDTVRLLVYPLTLGKGPYLFEEGMPGLKFTLVESDRMASGVVSLVYEMQ